jgi:hypothetical protein
MPLQNRVAPWGEIVAVPQRGMFTGNRGIIHDPATQTLLKRRWTTKAWITCDCEFRGRRRQVMAARSWTELFFLDEATALAAGHRPCFYCRRDDARAFADAWARGNGRARVSAREIDAVLHRERLDGKAKRLHPLPCATAGLPDGAMVQARIRGQGKEMGASSESGGAVSCYLIARGRPLRWSLDGYRADDGQLREVSLLTPPSTLRALGANYRPLLHSSASTN